MSGLTLLDAMADPQLMGRSFEGDSWETWRAVLSGAFALPQTPSQRQTFQRLAKGRTRPTRRVRELFVIAGRRSAKSNVSAAVSVYLATIGADVALSKLAPGEIPVIALLACDRYQARVLSAYITGIMEASPVLAGMIHKVAAESIELTSGVRIEILTNNYRAVRGRTLLAAILDEVAFYRSDATANPDLEVYRAVIPSLATTGGLLVGISSPYSKKGLLWSKYKKHFGKDGDVLVVQGSTRDFNPTLDKAIIDEAMEDDPEAAKAEWFGQFRNDIAGFVTREVAEACVSAGVFERGRLDGVSYYGFCDPSGGSSDSMTMAIAHAEGERILIDLIREAKPPFSPESVAQEFAETFLAYGITTIEGDRFAGEWPREQFQKHGVRYSASAAPKSELYKSLLPRLNSGQIDLIDNQRMLNQLCNLERRTARGGRDSVDHAAGQHDDLINSVAGVAAMVKQRAPAVPGLMKSRAA